MPEGEADEVVGPYSVLVPGKIARGLVAPGPDDEDALGSAKVATLALHRVIEVLSDWCAAHPLDGGALSVLTAASDLLQPIESAFPGHLAFRRPGLDPA